MSALHIGVLVNPWKQSFVATNLPESPWAGRLGKLFPRADILFLPASNIGHQGKRMGKASWAQDSCLLPPGGAELQDAEETEVGAARWW